MRNKKKQKLYGKKILNHTDCCREQGFVLGLNINLYNIKNRFIKRGNKNEYKK